MKGLYFYKLASSYREDITKDCKLTVNEIDHNFITLKDSDVKTFYVDEDKKCIVLEMNGGDIYTADLSNYTQGTSVTFDKDKGLLEIHHDGIVDVIDELVTKSNLANEIVTNVVTDETLDGNGTANNPLGLTTLERTSMYKSVKKVIDVTNGEELPNEENNKLGDRYLTYEQLNEHGYLYSFKHAMQFAKELKGGWRIPSKEDWDNMLNAIEVCDEDRKHGSEKSNMSLGVVAGKYLKSQDEWQEINEDEEINKSCPCQDCSCNKDEDRPKRKHITAKGVDSYGMRILPSGYGDDSKELKQFGKRTRFWTSTQIQTSDVYVKRFDYDKSGVVQIAENPREFSSIRLVKDYDGSNFRGIETICGTNYKTILLPTNNTTHGYSIWLGQNVAANSKNYNPITPNNGENLSEHYLYYINEWNGFDWVKKVFDEGDSLMIENGPDGDNHAEYRLFNGKLLNVKKDTISSFENKYDSLIDDVNSRIDIIDGSISLINETLSDVSEKLDENVKEHNRIEDKLNEEIERSTQKDKYIQDRTLTSNNTTYKCADGELTLMTENPDNAIIIILDSNYGTF